LHLFLACLARRLRPAGWIFLIVCITRSAFAISCPVAKPHPVSEAEQAYLHGDFEHAAALYQQQLQQHANDPALIVGLAEALLKQQKLKEADDLVQNALASNPKSAPLLTALGDVQYREGTPWLAAATAESAMKLDPCYPKQRLLNARLLTLNSFYGSAASQLKTAHALDPHDPEIRRDWMGTLPQAQRIAELNDYLSTATGSDADDLKHLHLYLEHMKKQVGEPHKACRLVSNTATTSVNFADIMRDGRTIEAFGLDVKLNGHTARLQIDTGASGLLVSRSVAQHAGLKRFSETEIGGIGNDGDQSGYTAYADDIKIGSLEFRDCQVDVLDKRSVLDNDGLIGMDVFSHFLVTLDYPMRKLIVAPLPPRPDDQTSSTPTLDTANSSDDDDTLQADEPPAQTASGKVAVRGPRDRYIAPDMKDWTRIYRVGHMLMMPASLNDSEQKLFVLDTGSFTTTISPDVARKLTKVRSEDWLTVEGLSGKVKKIYTADNITFKFAKLAQKAQGVVAFDNSGISKDVGLDISGFIGITTIGQTTMSIDYRDGLVKFVYDPHRGYAYPASF
jgi:tetratricopeptide (TPR) repeat protein